MAKGNVKVVAGGVSQSHLNCVCEECLCERLDSVVAELKSCKYGNGPICDSECRYNIAKMRATWETLTLCGISWTVLSWKNRLEP